MITGLTPRSFQKLQLNAGALLYNFDYSDIDTLADLKEAIADALESGEGVIGFTEGGGTFQCTPEARQITGDGMRYPIVGSTVFDSWRVRLTGTMKEIDADHMTVAIPTMENASAVGDEFITLKVRTDLKPEDYMTNICWFGDLSDGGVVFVCIKNALNMTGVNMTFRDKGEGVLPFEFQGHCAELSEMDYAPVEIIFFNKQEEPEPDPEPDPEPGAGESA